MASARAVSEGGQWRGGRLMGCGLIPVDMCAMRAFAGTHDEWNLERMPAEQVHDLLRLPPDFRVRHIGVDYLRRCYLVMIEAAQLPDVPPGQMIPQVHPVLTVENGVIRLADLRIEQPHDYTPYW